MNILLFPVSGSHGETARSLSDYAEGRLEGYRRWRVTRHLARCRKCQAMYRSFLTALEALGRLGGEYPPADPAFAARVLDRVQDVHRRGRPG